MGSSRPGMDTASRTPGYDWRTRKTFDRHDRMKSMSFAAAPANSVNFGPSFVAVALELMDQGYLLSQDIPQVVKGAAARWDYLMR